MTTSPNTTARPKSKLDPLERIVPLGLKSAGFVLCGIVLYDAVDAYSWVRPGGPQAGFLNSMLHMWIDLPIHEGGHMLFFWFGRTLHILGGSFWQIMFPLICFGIALKQRHWVAPYALVWASINILDVSLYMRDAPLRIFPLLGGGHSRHDWYNLFKAWGVLNSAEGIADLTYYSGVVIGIGSIVGGFGWAVKRYINPLPYALPLDKSDIESKGPEKNTNAL